MESLLPISTGDFRSLSFSSRSSPRSRRETPVLPTFEPPPPPPPRPSFFLRSSSSFKSRKETGRGGWIARWQASRRLVPWIALILVWFYIGFRLRIQWSGESPGVQGVGLNESGRVLPGGGSGRVRRDEARGHHLDEEETANIGKDVGALADVELNNRILQKVEQNDGILEDVELHNGVLKTVEQDDDVPETEERNDGTEKNLEQDKSVVEAVEQDDDDLETEEQNDGIVKNLEQGSGTLATEEQAVTTREEPHLGRDVGPFDALATQSARALGAHEQQGCSNVPHFADVVRAKSFVLVFHELSMTGAPLAMLELATKIVRCGGKASAVVWNKRGGLLGELVRRGVSVLRDKSAASWRAAARADLVVASSAACTTWIEQYLRHNKKGGDRLVWWIMENRREYFVKSKSMLGKVHALVFLSETQVQLWRQWAVEDALALPSVIKVVSLSVSDELANSAGLNDETGTVESFLDARRKREALRDLVRKEMGLLESDYLVISLSSINPGKGQFLLLQAIFMVAEDNAKDESLRHSDASDVKSLGSERRERARNLKVLLGSVGSKSNKLEYLEKINDLVDTYPTVADMLLWTEATVHVAPLYAAADAYVMNAQGIGETFGRVTVEAMAFGLPVLGTDAGGTPEIVQANVSGLLHPPGQAAVPALARNLLWLLRHPELGVAMGKKGRARVQERYREAPMYEALATVFSEALQG